MDQRGPIMIIHSNQPMLAMCRLSYGKYTHEELRTVDNRLKLAEMLLLQVVREAT